MNFDHRNSYRYPGKGYWFDFWNCRIVIPAEKKWFFVMPYVISTDFGLRKIFYSCSSFSDIKVLFEFDANKDSGRQFFVQFHPSKLLLIISDIAQL